MTISDQATPETHDDEGRESFSAKLLTDTQYEDFMDVTKIVERNINTEGRFKEKLQDLSYAMARTENMKAERAEVIVRDLFKARTGYSLNEMRKQLETNFEQLTSDQVNSAATHIDKIRVRVETGDKITFRRAVSHEAADLGSSLNITDAAARSLIKDSFETKNEQSFYDWGKQLDEQFYKPQAEAARLENKANRDQKQSFTRRR
ncbi:polyhydroxyalkanoate synthesis regulator phasin [Labrenzia sp. EL_195]|nr:polyhydroxyalkanoate synthesis regulator phasin [Labrenzia sp. EL_195]